MVSKGWVCKEHLFGAGNSQVMLEMHFLAVFGACCLGIDGATARIAVSNWRGWNKLKASAELQGRVSIPITLTGTPEIQATYEVSERGI